MRLTVSRPRAALLLAALALCAVPAVFLGGYLGYCGVLTLASLYILSAAYAWAVARGLACEGEVAAGSCRRGGELPVRVALRNGTGLVCVRCRAEFYATDLLGDVRSREEAGFTLGPREAREVGFDVKFDHVGRYTVGLRALRVEGLLGAVSFMVGDPVRTTVNVLPRLHDLGRLALSPQVFNESQRAARASAADSVDCSGARDYELGDPLKLIHWNLSSHTGTPMTKVLESYGNDALTVVVCPAAPRYGAGTRRGAGPRDDAGPSEGAETLSRAYDSVMECAASLHAYAARHGMDAELLFATAGGRVERRPLRPGDDLAGLVDDVPRLEPCDGDGDRDRGARGDGGACGTGRGVLRDMLDAELGLRYANSNVAVCTAVLDEETARQASLLKRRQRSVAVFFAAPFDAPEDRCAQKAARLLREQGVDLYVVPSADKIERAVGA